MFNIAQPFSSRDGSNFIAAAVVGDTVAINETNRTGLTTSVTKQPAGSALTTTDGANGSTIGPLTHAGVHVISVSSATSGSSVTAVICCWPAAVLADGGPLTFPAGAARAACNKLNEQQKRLILSSIARELGRSASDASFTAANVFPNISLAQFGL